MKRAEQLLWEKIPEGKWLSRGELREILRDGGSTDRGYQDQQADAAIGWLLDGSWVTWRQDPKWRPRRFEDPRAMARPQIPAHEFRRNPASAVPFLALMKEEEERAALVAEQVRAAQNEPLDRRLRELGLLSDKTNEPTPLDLEAA